MERLKDYRATHCVYCNQELESRAKEIAWLRLMLKTYQRTEYPESSCPWEQAMRNRLNEVAGGQGQLFLHGKVVE